VVNILIPAALFAQERNVVTVIENFDGGKALSDMPLWSGNAFITDEASDIKVKNVDPFAKETSYVKFDLSKKTTVELTLTTLITTYPAIFSFRYRTEIDTRAQQSFKVYVDGALKETLTGTDIGWRSARIKLAGGAHELRFAAENARGTLIVGGYNAVFLDDVTIFPDAAASITLSPRGLQETFLAGTDTLPDMLAASKLKFTASALYADGSVKTDENNFTYKIINAGGVSAAPCRSPGRGFCRREGRPLGGIVKHHLVAGTGLLGPGPINAQSPLVGGCVHRG
jgi:hypothetical protein